MRNDNLSIGLGEVKVYYSPVCEVIFVGTQKVVCASETEKVDDNEGEW